MVRSRSALYTPTYALVLLGVPDEPFDEWDAARDAAAGRSDAVCSCALGVVAGDPPTPGASRTTTRSFSPCANMHLGPYLHMPWDAHDLQSLVLSAGFQGKATDDEFAELAERSLSAAEVVDWDRAWLASTPTAVAWATLVPVGLRSMPLRELLLRSRRLRAAS